MNKILSTKDYSIFKRVWHNRKLNSAHLKNLTASIATKNLLQYTPIIVNEKMEVIDGQHRLEVAKRNKLEIYYIIADDVATSDILLLNANERPWAIPDFIDSWEKQGIKDYKILKEFMDKYELPASISACMLSGISTNAKHTIVRIIKEGEFEVTEQEKATEQADRLTALIPFCQNRFWKNRDFLRAYLSLYPKLDWDKFVEQLTTMMEATGKVPLRRQLSQRDTVLMFEDIYNYNKKNRERLY